MNELLDAVKAMKQSEYLMNSLVEFMVGLLEAYAGGRMTPEQLTEEYVRQLSRVKFYFMQMPRELAAKNLEAFSNELTLADVLNRKMRENCHAGEAEFTQMLLQCVNEYLGT